MMTNKAVKLDESIYNRLKSLGESRQRTPHWLMKEAIKQFLEREEEAEKIRADTLQRLSGFDSTGKTVAYEVIEEWLASWGSENEGQCPVHTA
ncbi:MAG: ribbon-helix-helix protein, CopG family [Pseudomonadota bacterium]